MCSRRPVVSGKREFCGVDTSRGSEWMWNSLSRLLSPERASALSGPSPAPPAQPL